MKKLVAFLLSLVMVLSLLTVAVFAEPGDVDDEPDDMEVIEPADEEPDTNPTTGVALAVLPMVIAAAAAVASKKH